ncbi:TPA: hypothetical protein EYO12_01550 [Candidatus Saccharibacteria bacterium]|jgi:hypothetical protein|nr:hypothetical protein [Candidatus Saccharibacteria bacterium]HIO87401.1 hypothetical protein [Candidatus Saccharibacteria bacterium]
MSNKQSEEPDSLYFLKIVLFFILGGVWIAFDQTAGITKTIPIGFIVGLLFAHHDHFQLDRKIEYAILLASAALSYVAPLGLVFLL